MHYFSGKPSKCMTCFVSVLFPVTFLINEEHYGVCVSVFFRSCLVYQIYTERNMRKNVSDPVTLSLRPDYHLTVTKIFWNRWQIAKRMRKISHSELVVMLITSKLPLYVSDKS